MHQRCILQLALILFFEGGQSSTLPEGMPGRDDASSTSIDPILQVFSNMALEDTPSTSLMNPVAASSESQAYHTSPGTALPRPPAEGTTDALLSSEDCDKALENIVKAIPYLFISKTTGEAAGTLFAAEHSPETVARFLALLSGHETVHDAMKQRLEEWIDYTRDYYIQLIFGRFEQAFVTNLRLLNRIIRLSSCDRVLTHTPLTEQAYLVDGDHLTEMERIKRNFVLYRIHLIYVMTELRKSWVSFIEDFQSKLIPGLNEYTAKVGGLLAGHFDNHCIYSRAAAQAIKRAAKKRLMSKHSAEMHQKRLQELTAKIDAGAEALRNRVVLYNKLAIVKGRKALEEMAIAVNDSTEVLKEIIGLYNGQEQKLADLLRSRNEENVEISRLNAELEWPLLLEQLLSRLKKICSNYNPLCHFMIRLKRNPQGTMASYLEEMDSE